MAGSVIFALLAQNSMVSSIGKLMLAALAAANCLTEGAGSDVKVPNSLDGSIGRNSHRLA
jgi:hypothetical protein